MCVIRSNTCEMAAMLEVGLFPAVLGVVDSLTIVFLERISMLLQSTVRALDHAVATEQSGQRLPSLATGWIRDNSLAHAGLAGFVDGRADGAATTANTQYRMGSITKTFVAVEILRLRDEGKLSLTDPFGKHVPGTGLAEAPIAGLLSHTGGVQAESHDQWWERTPGCDFAELGDNVGLVMRPGRAYHYSNTAYGALGHLVSVLRGKPWFEAVSENILRPLEMDRTTMRPTGPFAPGWGVHPYADVMLAEPEHDAESMAPAGQFWSTVEDLSRWVRFAAGDTAGILSADTLAESMEPQGIADVPGKPWNASHGLGWQMFNIEGSVYAGHSGSMPGHLAFALTTLSGPGKGDGFVTLTNATSGHSAGWPFHALRLLSDTEPQMPKPWVAQQVDAEMLELAGRWYWGTSEWPLKVTGPDEFLLGAAGGGRSSRFKRTGPDTFVGLDTYYKQEEATVERNADGSINHLRVASMVFTQTPYDADAKLPGGFDDAGWQPVVDAD